MAGKYRHLIRCLFACVSAADCTSCPWLLGVLVAVASILLVCAPARASILYITYGNSDNYVEEFSSSGTSGVNTDLGPLPSTTAYNNIPNGIAYDSHGNLYVANDNTGAITKFGPNGNYIGIFASGLSLPAAMAFDATGNLYVVNAGTSSFLKINSAGVVSVFVSSGLVNPQGIAVGPDGNIYVSDQNKNGIFKITPAGQMSTFYQDGSYTILNQVEGLAFDANGKLYAASYRTNSIEKFSSTGVPTLFANNPASNPQGISNPTGLAFDSTGDLFVVNYQYSGTDYIDELSSTGTLINAFTGNPSLPGADADLRQACYIAIANSSAPPPDSLVVTATSNFVPVGVIGGPFTPVTNTYTITNSGTSTLLWSGSSSQPWLTLSATSGAIGTSGSAAISASVNGNAYALPAGNYLCNITFTNVTSGYTQTEVVSLFVNNPAASGAPVFSNPLGVIAYSGAAFSFNLTASNSPTSFGASNLPSGLGINTATGVISGTATATGQSVVAISAANASGTTSTSLVITVSPPATWGPLITAPPNTVTVTSTNRNNVFYVGNPIILRLGNYSAAASYEIRDYWGNLVEEGPAAEFIYPQVTTPGWYKIYIKGSQYQSPWGWYVGASTFVIWRNDPNFPPMPPPGTWGGNGLDDGVASGITGIGPIRHAVDCTDSTNSVIAVQQAIAVDNQYYTPFDPVRHREILCAFPNGTSNLQGVAYIVSHLKDSVKYWEPLNEPNFTSDPASFVNNQLIPFYNTVKGIDPTAKVLGPEIVTIGPPEQGWVQGFIAAGGTNYIDGFSFHAYNNVNGDLWLANQTMSYLDSILAQAPNLERWQTEQGYIAALLGSYEPRLQGRWTMLQMMVFEQHRIPKEHNSYYYTINGGFWGEPTWWENNDGTFNPVGSLMRVWSEELFGTTFTSAFDFGVPGNKLYVGDLFQGPGKKVAAFMTAGSPSESIQLTDTGDTTVKTVSPFGVEQTIPVQNGQLTLPISEVPSYVEFSGTLGVVPINSGTDIALLPGTTATASGDGLNPSDPSELNNTSKIIDGVLQNWYWSQNPSSHPWMDDTPQFPAWVQVNFPTPQTINNVIIYAGNPWQLDGTLLDYDLQYDNNGQWVTLGTVNEPTKSFQAYWSANWTQVDTFFSDRSIFQHSFPPVTTSKIRLYVRDATWGGGATQLIAEYGGQTGQHKICLREIEVYNSPNSTNATQNLPPVVTGTVVTTAFETPVTIPVLNNASDPDGGPKPIYIDSVDAPANGTVSISGTQVYYNPRPGFSGTDAFTYSISDGQASVPATVNITVNPPPASLYAPMSGLINFSGQYYGAQNLTNLLFTRIDPGVNFDWGFNSPIPTMPTTHYSVLWSGTLQPAYSENYTFYTNSSDGCRLWVNNQLLIDDWVDQPATQKSWNLHLQAGQQYPIVFEYYCDLASSIVSLSWASPSQPKQIIPLFPAVPPLKNRGLSMVIGQYYGTTSFTNLLHTRIDNTINFDWSNTPPFPDMSLTKYSVKWTGQILAQYTQPHTFYLTSDDGARLYINGNLVINDFNGHGPTLDTATVQLQAGQYYSFEMDYYQDSGGAVAQLLWSCPNFAPEVIQQLPEEAWADANFNAAQLGDSTFSGPTASADGDGLSNLLKYAFDINPFGTNYNGMPALTYFTQNGHSYMALIYHRNSSVTDLTYAVQVSSTLAPGSWSTVSSPEQVLGQDPASGDLIIQRSVDVTSSPEEFMRINITR